MKNWEDKIKEKLEGYESALPEGSLAQLYAVIDADIIKTPKKHLSLIWTLSTAIAAGLAILLFLTRLTDSEQGLDSSVPDYTNTVASCYVNQQRTTPLYTTSPIYEKQPEEQEQVEASYSEPEILEPINEGHVSDSSQLLSINHDSQANFESAITSIELNSAGKNLHYLFKNDLASGGILGTGMLATIAGVVISDNIIISANNERVGHLGSSDSQEQLKQDSLVYSSHSMPLKLGLSTKIDITDRLFMTLGLEYARYSSLYVYSLTGVHNQIVQYLNIPLRLNYTIASINCFDIYAGAGIEGNYCIGAKLNGDRIINKDGLSVSIIGAGGVHIHVSPHMSMYIEPQLSWTIPSESRVLTTYCSDHPLALMVATGLRIDF